MTKITILYPKKAGGRFDLDYYVNTHMPLSIKLLGAAPGFKSVSVERGVSGPAPGTEPAFVAACHYVFETAEQFVAAFLPNAPRLQGDMPNYTDIAPIIQVNEIVLTKEAER